MNQQITNVKKLKKKHKFSVKPSFYSFDEDEEDFESEVDYQECMCSGNIQQNGISCNKCSGPLRDGFL